MKARLGAVLFGIGVASLALAAGTAYHVAPSVTKLPYDLAFCNADGKPDGCLKASVAVAENATFMQVIDGKPTIQNGTLKATTEVVPQASTTEKEMTGDLDGEAVVWQAYGRVVRTDNGSDVSLYSAELALDRETAAARKWDKQFLDTDGEASDNDSVEFQGQTYKFPFHAERKDYEYFDRDLRRALPIRFDGTEQVKGIAANRYVQVIPEAELAVAEGSLTALANSFAPGATTGKVTYSNTRTIWVEPTSGNFVKVREQQKKTFVPDQGAAVTLLDADFAYDDATITNSVTSAGETRDKLQLIGRTLPIALAVLGGLLLIVGLWLIVAGRRSTADARHRADGAPAPVDGPTRQEKSVTDERTGGPLSDEIPPASTNWRADGESAAPAQRTASDEAEKH
ncbi:DUF3068 domain-containing protein [Micromonospora sp. KC606]|uniref:DUF3068 domain-containing protein n=1 Tax=Micromonospora sp. KC606 TaxID=2530379 RepID=UPI001047E338|nr:DUF3068 domain-containing protein [Micromonospora sp. KC606]TDC81958.1 DUF3068 domain-containing protein [Micromonospora sp. KC606]